MNHLTFYDMFLDELLLAELEKIDGECKKYDVDFVKIEFVYRTFHMKIFLPPTIAHFLIELQTGACQASFGKFSRQPGPVLAGATAACCYVMCV